MKKSASLIIPLLLFVASADAALVLTFDPPTLKHGGYSLTTYSESGVVFTGTLSGSFAHTDTGLYGRPDDGSAHLDITRYYTQFKFQNGSLFTLDRLDLAEYSTVYAYPQRATFHGYKPDNSIVVFSFTTDGIIDGTGPLADFQTVYFPDTFSGLQRVEFAGAGYAIDNVHLTLVPEPSPAILALFGGVCGGAWRRSRRVSPTPCRVTQRPEHLPPTRSVPE
jgi:hypothetical protein